ncbi:MAG: alpha/beta hydrolase [Chloroflexi bacterium]|nr:alpha/beta hydrolase [Chloroflexota bacterium]MBT7081219.1 alpha/beta hydrolase [Chloroflexota bacterium]
MPHANNNGVRIYYKVEGDGPPLVLLHPVLSSHKVWYANGYVDALKSSHKIILPDIRGHGDSDKPHEPQAYTQQIRAMDIVAVLDNMGIDKAHFLGYSTGGFIGFAVAKYAQDRLKSLMIGAAHPYTLTSKSFAHLNPADTEAFFVAFEGLIGQAVSPQMKATLLQNDLRAIAASLKQGFASTEDGLAAINVPSLIFVGDKDMMYADVAKCAGSIASATFMPMQGLGHYDTLKRSDLMLPHIKAFLKGVK